MPSAATVSSSFGTNAAHIVGQPDFTTVTPGLAGNRLQNPSGVFADTSGGLWVLDGGNNRAIRFAKISSLNIDDPASTVIGQSGFTGNTAGLDARRVSIQSFSSASSSSRMGPYGWETGITIASFVTPRSMSTRPPFTSRESARSRPSNPACSCAAPPPTIPPSLKLGFVYVGRKQILASGTTTWKKSIRLKIGRNVVTADRDRHGAGHPSTPAKVIIIRE